MRRVAMVLFLGCCSFLGGVLAVVMVGRSPNPAHAEPPPVPPPVPQTDQLIQLGNRFELVASKVSPTVVAIEAVKPAAPSSTQTKKSTVDESGSGVLMRIPGQRGVFALTNNH